MFRYVDSLIKLKEVLSFMKELQQNVDENGFVGGWYYQRQTKWKTATDAPQGRSYVTFQNEDPGRHSHLLQGFAIDGRARGAVG